MSVSDTGGDRFTCSGSYLPSGASLSNTSGQFNWIPFVGLVGNYIFTFELTDVYLANFEAVIMMFNSFNNASLITTLVMQTMQTSINGDSITIDVKHQIQKVSH